jgi:hypothetical protein
MVISATRTSLSEDIAKQRIRAIIDADSRIKSEIDAREKALESPPRAFSYLLLPSGLRRAQQMKKPYVRGELDRLKKLNARDQAVYAQYLEDDIFAAKVDAELR